MRTPSIEGVFLQTYLDPDYCQDDSHPQDPTESSPIPLRLKISRQYRSYLFHESSRGRDLAQINGNPQFYDCDISLFRDDQQQAFNNLLPKFDSLSIDARYCRPLAVALSQEVIRLLASEKTKELSLICVIHVETLYHCRTPALLERAKRETKKEIKWRNHGMLQIEAEPSDVKVEEKSICPLCLEDLREFASALPCQHLFHHGCIDLLFEVEYDCPVCHLW